MFEVRTQVRTSMNYEWPKMKTLGNLKAQIPPKLILVPRGN